MYRDYLLQGYSPEEANAIVSQEQNIYINSADPNNSGYSVDNMSDLGPSAPPAAPAAPAGGGTGGTTLELPTRIFNGRQLGEADYWGALDESITEELLRSLGLLGQGRTKARGDTDRSKSRLMEQVTQMLQDLLGSEQKGNQDIDAYYGGLGDLYQSSQGVRKDQFGQEVATERTRVNTEKTNNIDDIDRALAEYLQGTDQEEQGLYRQANQLRDQNFSSTAEFAGQLAANPNSRVRSYNTNVGAPQVTDTSALLKQLNAFLTPASMRRSYDTPGQGNNPLYQYLNPA